MKKALLTKLMLLLCALIAGSSSVWADEAVFTFNTDAGLQELGIVKPDAGAGTNLGTDPYVISGVSLSATNGSTPTRVWNSSGNLDLRIYKNGTFTFQVSSGNITSIVLDGTTVTGFTATDGTFSNGTWSGNAASVVLTATATQKINTITVTYSSGGTPTCATPTFSPAGGTYESAQNVTISTTTEGATIYYTTDGTNPTNSSSVFSSAINVTKTTTIKAMAVKAGSNNSSVASATYTIVSPLTIAEVRAQATGSVLTQGIVTSCVGTTGYIQDGTAAICVYGTSLTVGDDVKVSGTLTTYKGLLEITSPTVTVVSSGNSVDPVVKTIAEINSDYSSGSNALQGMLVKIVDATVTTINGQNTTIAQDLNSIVVRGISNVEFNVNDILTLVGNIGCFDAAQIANPTNVVVTPSATPLINASDITIEADATSGEIAYTITNPTGATLSAALTEGNWISNVAVAGNKVTFTATANNGDERTATITLSYTGATDKVVTVTQKKYVPAAALPFAFDGGSADVATTDGLSQNGLGSYGSSPKLKFDGADDELVLKIGGAASVLNFDIKGNGSGNTPWAGVFKVQTSADGVSYTDLATYTDANLTSTISHESLALASSVRYIKWIYTEKTTGNVALGRIGVDCELVTVPAIGYMTVCYPSNVDLVGTGVKAYVVSEIGATYVELEEIESVPANTPVILEASEGSYVLNYTASPAAVGTNLLQVSDGTATTNDANIVYALASKGEPAVLGFYKVKKNTKVPAGKCYLSVAAATPAPEFLGFGGATGIENVNRETITNNRYFNLNGQRVAQPTKGLYIVNGKKVVIK